MSYFDRNGGAEVYFAVDDGTLKSKLSQLEPQPSGTAPDSGGTGNYAYGYFPIFEKGLLVGLASTHEQQPGVGVRIQVLPREGERHYELSVEERRIADMGIDIWYGGPSELSNDTGPFSSPLSVYGRDFYDINVGNASTGIYTASDLYEMWKKDPEKYIRFVASLGAQDGKPRNDMRGETLLAAAYAPLLKAPQAKTMMPGETEAWPDLAKLRDLLVRMGLYNQNNDKVGARITGVRAYWDSVDQSYKVSVVSDEKSAGVITYSHEDDVAMIGQSINYQKDYAFWTSFSNDFTKEKTFTFKISQGLGNKIRLDIRLVDEDGNATIQSYKLSDVLL